MNYTPVPLLTLSAGHKQARVVRMTLALAWKLIIGLATSGKTTRYRQHSRASNAGRQRYDLVERNNNIVLEYRKSEVSVLLCLSVLKARAARRFPWACGQQSNSRSEKCAMGSAVFLAAGGKITGQGNQWQVTLPAIRQAKTIIMRFQRLPTITKECLETCADRSGY